MTFSAGRRPKWPAGVCPAGVLSGSLGRAGGAQVLLGLLRFEEDAVGHGGRDRLPGPLDLELDPYLAVLDGHHGEPDVLLQPRRVAGRRDLADPLVSLVYREVVDHGSVIIRPDVPAPDLDADQLA